MSAAVSRGHVGHFRLLVALAAATALLALVSILIGYAHLDLPLAIRDAFVGVDSIPALVLTQLRVPRALLGVIVGFSLGMSGAAMQGFLRNPLAEPGLLGVSSGAALGAVLTLYYGASRAFPLALPLGGICGAVIVTLMLYAFIGYRGGTTRLIIAGVALNALAGACVSLALNLSPSPYASLEIVFWLMGSLADRSMSHVWLILIPSVSGWFLMISCGRALDALTLGEDTARSLGFDIRRIRIKLVAGTALAVGSAVAVTGVIGFVGLVVPHLVRPFVGRRPGALLVVSGFGGSILTLAADIAVRLAPTRPELKLGVLTALIGGPFLVALIRRAGTRET